MDREGCIKDERKSQTERDTESVEKKGTERG